MHVQYVNIEHLINKIYIILEILRGPWTSNGATDIDLTK